MMKFVFIYFDINESGQSEKSTMHSKKQMLKILIILNLWKIYQFEKKSNNNQELTVSFFDYFFSGSDLTF